MNNFWTRSNSYSDPIHLQASWSDPKLVICGGGSSYFAGYESDSACLFGTKLPFFALMGATTDVIMKPISDRRLTIFYSLIPYKEKCYGKQKKFF